MDSPKRHHHRIYRSARICTAFAAAWLLSASLLAGPLPHDERILTGHLDNGVTWFYREHNNPPGKMALMMRVGTGSLNETDRQKGLAHFMEHMCFNGTEHFPPGKLIPYFESIGMQFGADLNAFTSFDQTAYMLFTPDTKTEQIDKALLVLSDYAFRASLTPEEIDKERGVVLEEARSGKSAFQRIRDKLWPELFSGSRFADRLPIGDEKIIATAKREDFVDYYRTYYRPTNISVMLVGDAKPDAIIPLIQKAFGEYRPTVPSRAEMGPEFKPFTRQRFIVVTDPEMAYCQIQMMDIRPGRPPAVTVDQWRTEVVESLGDWIMGRRFDNRVKKGEAHYRGAGTGVSDFFNDALLCTVEATGEAKDWERMLKELVADVGRARAFGFTDHELDLARKAYLADAEHAVNTEPTRNARAIINEIVSAVNEKTPILSAQQKLDLYKELLPSIKVPEVSTSFKTHFTPDSFAFVVTSSSKSGTVVPSREEVMKVASAALSEKVTEVKEDAVSTNLLAAEPRSGRVVESSTDKDLDITSAWLDNGVRVHHRFMDYKKDSVILSISFAGGEIEETADNKGITTVATLAVDEAATHRLSSAALRDLMTGKNISVSAYGAVDVVVMQISGSPKDLESGMREAYALATDGVIEESAFKNWKLSTLQSIEQREKNPQFKAFEALQDLLSGGDPRRLPLSKINVEALAIAPAQAWFEGLCQRAPAEVAIVGDITWADARPLIEKYIGSLPRRDRSAARLDKLRHLHRGVGPLVRHLEVDTVTPQAMALTGFAAAEGRNTADCRGLGLAANILTSRLIKRIREDMSLVYSISANSTPSWIFEDAGSFLSGAPCDPANVSKVADEVNKMFGEFAETGPTAEELDNAKKQIANHLDTSMREPSYWWGVLRDHDLHHRSLEEQKIEKKAYADYPKDQVQEVFRKYYKVARSFRVTAVPVKATKPDANKKE